MKIIEAICTENRVYQAGGSLNPVGVVLHSVGTPQPSAEVFVKIWSENRSPYFTHYVLDDKDIYHTMTNDRRCWHVGSPGNSKWLGIEMCEPNTIKYTGGATFKVIDKAAAQAFAKACYSNAVWLLAKLCKEYGWNPQTAILTHNEVTQKKLSSTDHVDPEHLWKGLGLSYTLAGLRNDVSVAMGKEVTETPEEEPAKTPAASTNTVTKETRYTMNMRTLKKDCKGDDVKALQIMLRYYGYNIGTTGEKKDGVDGSFGPATDKAVRAYQKDHGLAVDGKAGPATMGSLLGV